MVKKSGASGVCIADGKHSQLSKRDAGELYSTLKMWQMKQREDLVKATKPPHINYIKHCIQLEVKKYKQTYWQKCNRTNPCGEHGEQRSKKLWSVLMGTFREISKQ